MDYVKNNLLQLVTIVLLVVVLVLRVGGSGSFGAPANLTTVGNPWNFTSTGQGNGVIMASTTITALKIGQAGTQLANSVTTTCSPVADNSITATSTGYAYCTGVTGVTSADSVVAMFSTSTQAFVLITDNFWIISAKASTTPGAVDFLIYNGTGKNAAPSAVGRSASTTVIRAGR